MLIIFSKRLLCVCHEFQRWNVCLVWPCTASNPPASRKVNLWLPLSLWWELWGGSQLTPSGRFSLEVTWNVSVRGEQRADPLQTLVANIYHFTFYINVETNRNIIKMWPRNPIHYISNGTLCQCESQPVKLYSSRIRNSGLWRQFKMFLFLKKSSKYHSRKLSYLSPSRNYFVDTFITFEQL